MATTPTKKDLDALHGGPFSLLSVRAVAERLGVGAWAVYRLCETGELPHVRITNSIRVRPADLEAFIAARVSAAPRKPGRRRSSE